MNASLKLHRGAMTLFVNGNPVPFVSFKSTEMLNDALFAETVAHSVPDMAARGVHVNFVPIFFDWTAHGIYDFSRMDWRVSQVLKADPNAWIVIRIQAASMAPKWWMDSHPDEVFSFGFAKGNDYPFKADQTLPAPSVASSFWEEEGLPALRALAEHAKSQPYASRLIGYLPTAYNTNEWFFRSRDAMHVVDLCPAMQTAFNQWLEATYGISGSVPNRMDRHNADHDFLFDPDPRRSAAPVTAFYQYLNQCVAETIVKVCKVLREVHTPDHIIVGTFYGYSLELAQFHWLADSGHLAYERLLQEDGPDFTCSPLTYFTRNIHETGGAWTWSLSTAADSARIHGKAYYGEDDYRPVKVGGITAWTGPQTVEEDVETLRRNFTFGLCKGQLQWWYDIGGGYFYGKERLEAVKQCAEISRQSIERDRSSVSQVAVVMDEKAPMSVQLDLELQRSLFWQNFFNSFSRIGAPVDLMMLSDLHTADLSQYKAIFFPTCFSMTGADRQRIEALKKDGRTLVFYQADGYLNPESDVPFDVERVSSLCGMQVKADFNYGHCFLRLSTREGHPLLEGFEDQPFGNPNERHLLFYLDDPSVEPLAHHHGRGVVGMGCKTFPDWTSIYCAVPEMPAQLVSNIIRQAGVHIYTSDRMDLVYACADYVAVYTRRSGERTLWLPEAHRITELFHDAARTDRKVKEVRWNAQPYTTYLFQLD